MEFIFEAILPFLGEMVLQMVFELLIELGLHSIAETARKPRNPFFSLIGSMLLGAMAGGSSLWIFPASFIENSHLRVANLLATPAAMGGVMVLFGRLRCRMGQDPVDLDRFGYAFIFAFVMALVRFSFAA